MTSLVFTHGTITAQNNLNPTFPVAPTQNAASVTLGNLFVRLGGVFTATVLVEELIPGGNWTTLDTLTTAGGYQYSAKSVLNLYRLRCSSFTSGFVHWVMLNINPLTYLTKTDNDAVARQIALDAYYALFPTTNNTQALGAAGLQYASVRAVTFYGASPLRTTTQISDKTDTINTVDKAVGVQVFNTTSKQPLYAIGTTATSAWVDATGATIIIPS